MEASDKSRVVVYNTAVRGLLVNRGIKPEDLPPEEDVKKLDRRISSEERKMVKKGEWL